MQATASPRFAETLLKLRQLATGAEQFYGWTKVTKKNQFWQIHGSASDRMPDELGRLLLSIANDLFPGRQLHRHGIVMVPCKDEATIRLITRYAATPYWFWHIMRLASEQATDLPLAQADIWSAIEAISQNTAVPGVGSGVALRRPKEICSPQQLSALHDAGVLIDNNKNELEPNPIFA